MFPTPYVASLRVYEPIDSFDEKLRDGWRKFLHRKNSTIDEQFRALSRVVSGVSTWSVRDGFHYLEIGEEIYVAPWSTMQRSWQALNEFRSSLPAGIARFFLPSKSTFDLDASAPGIESRVSNIRTETWMIPARWFALFEPEDRFIGSQFGVAFSLARTSISTAKQRCIRTHEVVKSAFGVGNVEEELADLVNWLNVFDSKSIVELDYGGLAQFLDNVLRSQGLSGLEADSSIEDVNESIQGLITGDGLMAGKGYERLSSRWRSVAIYEQAN